MRRLICDVINLLPDYNCLSFCLNIALKINANRNPFRMILQYNSTIKNTFIPNYPQGAPQLVENHVANLRLKLPNMFISRHVKTESVRVTVGKPVFLQGSSANEPLS